MLQKAMEGWDVISRSLETLNVPHGQPCFCQCFWSWLHRIQSLECFRRLVFVPKVPCLFFVSEPGVLQIENAPTLMTLSIKKNKPSLCHSRSFLVESDKNRRMPFFRWADCKQGKVGSGYSCQPRFITCFCDNRRLKWINSAAEFLTKCDVI